MRRYLLTLALAGLFGAFASTDVQACHKKKKCATPVACAAPAPVVVAPCPPPAPPVCETVVYAPTPKKKCGLLKGGHKKMSLGGLCHKKAPVVCATPAYYPTPVSYEAAPVYAAPQGSPQAFASGQ